MKHHLYWSTMAAPTKYITKSSILLLCVFYGISLAAHEHGAHQHGVASINLVIEDKDITIEFTAPASNIIGFERAPTTNQERQQIKNQLRELNNPSSLFVFNKGTCRSVRQKVDSPFDVKYSAKDHYDIDADYEFACDSTSKIRSMSNYLKPSLLYNALTLNGLFMENKAVKHSQPINQE